ncbi:FkbM family methyltransferase [Bradyrhizobium retamae]|uniref:FkbM family methyltransferase n=1 Tax=Bradyrhizobium retamae TaxID=1300035 RepID=UPI0007C7787F|nr:FkbM family methyltransferase [Bradyrhizobium retamae]
MRKISVVTPCYNEELNVDGCYRQVRALFDGPLKRYDYEHIFCDNSSTDRTCDKVRAIAAWDSHVKLIVNSRNFGPFANIFNGLTASCGDAVVVMLAADLQDPPAIMVDFVRLWEQGYEVVYGIRQQREEAWLLRTSRRIFYRLVNSLSPFFIPENVGEYQLIDRVVAQHVIKMDDHFPYVRGMIAYCGFKATGVPYTWTRRRHGVSSSTFVRLVDQGLNGIISFSNVPIRLVLACGFAVAALSVLATLCLFIISALYHRELAPPGIPLLIMMVTFFFGIFLFVLGFIGEYIVAIHSQVRKRPLVIERERVNFVPAASPVAPLLPGLSDLKVERAEGRLDRNTFWRQASGRAALVRQLQPMLRKGGVHAVEIDADELRLQLTNGARFVWDPEDMRTAPNIALLDGEYKPQELVVLSNLTRKAAVIFDVGANVGWYAIHLASTVNKTSRIFCFEPVPSTRAKLMRNVLLNGLEDRVRIFDFGLSDQSGTTQFFLPEVSGSVAASAKNLHPEERTIQVSVLLEKLDDIVEREQIARIDLIKCDVEGGELHVLRGAARVIERDKPVIFLEMLRKCARQLDYHPHDIIRLLAESGYRCWAVGDHRLREIDAVDEETPETNYVFLHSDRRDELAAIADGSILSF